MTDAAVPFVGGRGLYVGLGTIAALLMVGVLWTGIIRARFADIGPKWVWRALHSMAYVSWPFAIFHGLLAGRAPAGWVSLSYFLCVVLVVVALLVRLSVTLQRRSREQHQAAALNEAMTGKGSEETRARSLLGNLTRRGGENERARRDTSWADSTSGTWASPTIRRNDPERFTVPVVPEPGSLRDPVRPGRTRRDEELEPVVRRASRRDEEELEPVVRRASRRDDESSRRRSDRREEEREPVGRRSTRRRDEEEELLEDDREPVGRRRRDEEESGRSRRSRDATDARSRYSAPPERTDDEAEEPWDSPRRWGVADLRPRPDLRFADLRRTAQRQRTAQRRGGRAGGRDRLLAPPGAVHPGRRTRRRHPDPGRPRLPAGPPGLLGRQSAPSPGRPGQRRRCLLGRAAG